MQVIKQQMEELGHIRRCDLCYDGEEAINKSLKIYQDVISSLDED